MFFLTYIFQKKKRQSKSFFRSFVCMKSVVRWLVDVSFRPPRHSYDPERTVSVVTNGPNIYVRKGASFKNNKDNLLYGSLWYDRSAPIPPNCLIYLHSLGTNQFEGLNLISFMCSPDLSVFTFDFPGCGISEGDYIPLDGSGINDVKAAVEYLDDNYHFEKYALWGRSMGAAIALQTASSSLRFCCCVSDSAFKNTKSVVYDQADQNGIPKFAISLIEPIIKHQANQILHTDVLSPSPLREVPFSQTPLLMGHGKQDSFVTLPQAQYLFDMYGCPDKQLYIFDARHNSVRPYQWYETASRFIYRKMGLTPNKRFYDAVFNSSMLHSGLQERILEDVDKQMEEAKKALEEKLKKAQEEEEKKKNNEEHKENEEQSNEETIPLQSERTDQEQSMLSQDAMQSGTSTIHDPSVLSTRNENVDSPTT